MFSSFECNQNSCDNIVGESNDLQSEETSPKDPTHVWNIDYADKTFQHLDGRERTIYQEFLINAHDILRKCKYRLISSDKATENSANVPPKIDGSMILTKYDADDLLLELLHNT